MNGFVPSDDLPGGRLPPGASNGHGNNTHHNNDDDAAGAKDLETGDALEEAKVMEDGNPPMEDFSKIFKPLDDTERSFDETFKSTAFESAFHANFESSFDAKFQSRFSQAFQEAFYETQREEERKDQADEKYPRDCYSFIALGPIGKNYCIPFLFGCMVFFLQVSLLSFILFSKTYFFTSKWKALSQNEDIDNPDQSRDVFNGGSFIPANASVIVRSTQFVSVLAYVLVGGDSLNDFTKAVMYFPRATCVWLQVACLLRGLQGLLACVTAMLLVVTDNDVIGIVLNFAAIHFISSFDDTAYELAETGKYGRTLRQATDEIKEKDLPKCILKSYNPLCSELLYRLTIGTLGLVLMSIVILVTVYGERHDVWITRLLRVEFDEESGVQQYSGCFKMTNYEHHRRMAYQSYKLSDNLTASLGYCQKTRSWVFHKEDPAIDPCKLSNRYSELAHSSKTSSFDISTASGSTWFSLHDRPLAVKFIDNEQNTASEEHFSCDAHVGDGICDSELNSFVYQYDGGDCCATSCSRPEMCGTGSLVFESAFGKENVSGYGYPFTCKDPNEIELLPVDIHIDQIVELGNRTGATQIPYLTLICSVSSEYVQFFSIPLDKSMEGETQTIGLSDGLECSLHIETKDNETADGNSEIDATSFFDIKYHVFPALERHVATDHGDIGTNWNLGVYEGRTDTKKEFLVYQGYTKSSTELNAYDLNLYGTIPTEIGIFSSLKSISLGVGNYLEGSIPSEIGLLTSLTLINCERNSLDGKIPSEVGYLTGLAELTFNENQLQGSIISEIGYLTSLTEINLRRNNLVGSIPSEVGVMTSLSHLNLAANKITGTIPTEIVLLTAATHIQLDVNKLEGAILSEIGILTTLGHFDLGDNFLTGEIPTEIGLLTALTYLGFYQNKLQGPIPSEISLLTSLTRFLAFENELQTIPSEIGLMTSLTELWLHENQFEGSIPTEIGLLTSLEWLFLDVNNLTGEIPTEIGLLTSLKSLYLSDNTLDGPIPSEMGLLTSLTSLYLNSNFLTGDIPCELKTVFESQSDKQDIGDTQIEQKNGTFLEFSDECFFEEL